GVVEEVHQGVDVRPVLDIMHGTLLVIPLCPPASSAPGPAAKPRSRRVARPGIPRRRTGGAGASCGVNLPPNIPNTPCEKAPRSRRTWGPLSHPAAGSGLGQSLRDVGFEVFRRFEAHGEADVAARDAAGLLLGSGELAVPGARGVNHAPLRA